MRGHLQSDGEKMSDRLCDVILVCSADLLFVGCAWLVLALWGWVVGGERWAREGT